MGDDDTCSQCHGSGEIEVTEDDDENETVRTYKVRCGWCNGTGRK